MPEPAAITDDDFIDKVMGDLVARHMLGDLAPRTPTIGVFEASALFRVRDHRGRNVDLHPTDTLRGLLALHRHGLLSSSGEGKARIFWLPPIASVPLVCDVVDGNVVSARRVQVPA